MRGDSGFLCFVPSSHDKRRCALPTHLAPSLFPSCVQSDPKYLQGMRIQDPDKRLRYIVGMCASKRMDEATGAPQPAYKMDGMKIMLEFPKPKNEEEGPEAGERKQVCAEGDREEARTGEGLA